MLGRAHVRTKAGESFAVTAESPTVRLELESRPETTTLVRGMLGGVAEALSIDPELLDDLKTAISEACNNVVLHAYSGEPGPMLVQLFVGADGIRAVVEDSGTGIVSLSPPDERSQGLGVPVIQALADRAVFQRRPDGGTAVEMAFPAEREGRALFVAPAPAGPESDWPEQASDGIGLSLSPVDLLPGVLGRLARALAAQAHFSLDRFSDVYLVTDALAAHASGAASGPRIACSLIAHERRMELTLGPFKPGSGRMFAAGKSDPAARPLVLLSDEVSVGAAPEGESLRVVLVDHRR
jgi:serine/threonine-protein kinase RsbW